MKISFILPSRERPERFFRALANINDLSESNDYEIICAFDEDDETMNNDEVKQKLTEYENVKCFYGTSIGKIHACNREISKIDPETSIICLHSDDFEWLEYGFDNEIREAFKRFIPDFDGALHVPDGYQNKTITYTILGINFFNRFGYLYNPAYLSVFADNELTEVAQMLNKYHLVDKPKLRHNHPIFHNAQWDSLYRRNESAENYCIDRNTYIERKNKKFGL